MDGQSCLHSLATHIDSFATMYVNSIIQLLLFYLLAPTVFEFGVGVLNCDLFPERFKASLPCLCRAISIRSNGILTFSCCL